MATGIEKESKNSECLTGYEYLGLLYLRNCREKACKYGDKQGSNMFAQAIKNIENIGGNQDGFID